jgi:hypothetical protein
MATPMSDGVEIHYDDKRRYLELACEPDAFAAYRDLARQHLADFPEIDLERVIEINVVDTAQSVKKREVANRGVRGIFFTILFVLTIVLAGVGAISIISMLFKATR